MRHTPRRIQLRLLSSPSLPGQQAASVLGVHEGEDREVRVRAEADLDLFAGRRRGGKRGGEDGVGDGDA